MPSALSIVINNPSIRIGALAILFFGFSNAATAPYQAVIGIREIGLSNTVYSLLMLFAAVINVSASVLMAAAATTTLRSFMRDPYTVRKRTYVET